MGCAGLESVRRFLRCGLLERGEDVREQVGALSARIERSAQAEPEGFDVQRQQAMDGGGVGASPADVGHGLGVNVLQLEVFNERGGGGQRTARGDAPVAGLEVDGLREDGVGRRMRGVGREDLREGIQFGIAARGEFDFRMKVERGAEGVDGGRAGGRGKGVGHGAEERVADLARHDGVDVQRRTAGSEALQGGASAGDVALVGVGVEKDVGGRGAAGGRDQAGVGEVEPEVLAHLDQGIDAMRREVAERNLPGRPRAGGVGIERGVLHERRANAVTRKDEREAELIGG
jgi:hypothetical protein